MATLYRFSYCLALLTLLAAPGVRAQAIFANGFEPAARVVINEVGSNPDDLVELYNAGELVGDLRG